jgi:hypothetical protein
LAAIIMVWFAFYNFCRIHRTLRIRRRWKRIADHSWSVRELLVAS